MVRRFGHRVMALVVCLGFGLIAMPALAAPLPFAALERVSSDLSAFPKWTAVLAGIGQGEPVSGWNDLIRSQQDRPLNEQMQAVQAFVNATAYVEDPDNWGAADRWSTPAEFFARSGDCEDFAIAKFTALKQLGVDPERMQIVILRDRARGLMHAVLAVHDGSEVYILDNQLDQVAEQRAVAHYQPVFAVSERGWYRMRG